MHTSYLSLAVFALGTTAAPSFPKPNGDPFAGSFPFFPSGSSTQSDEDSGLSNPVPAYMAAMQAVQSAQMGAYYTPQSTPAAVAKPQHQQIAPAAAPVPQEEPEPFHHKAKPTPEHKPDPAVPTSAIAAAISAAMPSADGINHVIETPKATEALNSATQTPMPEHIKPTADPSSSRPMSHATPTHDMSSFISMASPIPTLRPVHSMGVHEGHMSSSKAYASPSSSATPSPSSAPATNPGLLGLASIVHSVPILGPMLSPLVGG